MRGSDELTDPLVLSDKKMMPHIDPRIKILNTFAQTFLLFAVKSNLGIIINLCFMALILAYFRKFLYVKRLLQYGFCLFLFMVLLGFLGSIGKFFGLTAYILFKFSPVLGNYYLMTKTVSISQFISALEKMKLPKSITITLGVTLRFIPTIAEEIQTIKQSMKIRNVSLSIKNILTKPITMLEYMLVPLMMRFVKISEELAASAIVRGIEKPGLRTSLIELKMTWKDLIYLIVLVIFSGVMYFFESQA